jgi:hypothetical protein
MLVARKTCRFLSLSLLMLAAGAIGAAGVACAQNYPAAMPAAQPAMQPYDAAADSLLALVAIRDVAEIQAEMNAAQNQRAEGEIRLQRALAMKARSETRIRLKQSELDAIKSRLDLAKKEKDEVRKLDLEGQKKQAELEKQLLERRADLRAREVEHAKAMVALATASARACEEELKLAAKRSQREALFQQPLSAALMTQIQAVELEIRQFEGQTLDARIQEADRYKDLSTKGVDLAKSRRKVYDMRLKVAGGS